MDRRMGRWRFLAAVLLTLAGAAGAAAQEPLSVNGELFWKHYIDFRAAQVYEASAANAGELGRLQDNIFYMGVDEREWAALEALLDGYFARLAAEGFRPAALAGLEGALAGYNVQLDTCNPVGYYSLWQDRVYVDRGLFRGASGAVWVKSVIYHEKVHEQQLRRLDGRALKVDQKQRYQNKLQEIGAHYAQIRWVLAQADGRAVEMTLGNSAREGMVPALLRYYPESDPVVQALRAYLRKYNGT